MDIKKLAEEVQEQVVQWRRDLHQIPEPGIELPQTFEYVTGVLDQLGIEYKTGVGIKYGIVGIIRGAKEGKTIALRADMDALPVIEETGLEFASKNNSMHACGHDAHTAILLGSAKILNENRENLSGNVVLIFQPGEEVSAGAKPMVEAGVLDNPKVDAILGMHVGGITNGLKNGSIGVCMGSMMACLDGFKLKVIGKGSHGAYPDHSIDPITISSYIVTAVQEIISREITPTDPGVITIGKFHGGNTYNVIPNEVEIEGTARAVNHETRAYLAKRIGEVAENLAKGFRANVEYEYRYGAPPLINDRDFTEFVEKSAHSIFPEEQIHRLEKPVMGGEDFAEYLQKVPGTFVFMQNMLPIDGVEYPHHNPRFALDESKFEVAISLMVKVVEDFLNQ